MHQPTAGERVRIQVTRCKEEQKVTELKKIIEIKLKEPEKVRAVPHRTA